MLFWPGLPTNTSVPWDSTETRSGNMDPLPTWETMYNQEYQNMNDFGTQYLMSTIFGGALQDAADNHFTEDQFKEMLHNSADAAATVAGAPCGQVQLAAVPH